MKNSFKVMIIALIAIIGFSMAACDNEPDVVNTDPKTIKIVDVPSNWSGTIGVYIFSDFKTGGVPVYTAGKSSYSFSGGVINADLSPFTGTGQYYITIQPNRNDTREGYAYCGSGSSPAKFNIKDTVTTISFNKFKQHNVWH